MTEREPLPEEERSTGAKVYDAPKPSQDQNLRTILTIVAVAAIVLLIIFGVIVWVTLR